jgi:prolipoprotein diacylglyceryltransferase
LANDDLILVKKNISVKQVFNVTLVVFLIGLFFSRLFFVIINPDPIFYSVLGFLVFPYFPGLSLIGGIIGVILALLIISKYKKFPSLRIFDFYAMALVYVLPLGWLLYIIFSNNFSTGFLVRLVFYILLFICFNFFLYPKSTRFELKDGSKALIFLIFFSLISLLTIAINNPGLEAFKSSKENMVSIAILTISSLIFIKNELLGKANLIKWKKN